MVKKIGLYAQDTSVVVSTVSLTCKVGDDPLWAEEGHETARDRRCEEAQGAEQELVHAEFFVYKPHGD